MKISQGKFYKALKDIISIPTAPFHESGVARYIRYFADREGLEVSNDTYGNLFVVYRGPKTAEVRHPVGMVAHMDHPGFEITGRIGRDLVAQWMGGLHPRYVNRDDKVIIHSGRRHINAEIKKYTVKERAKLHELTLRCSSRTPQVGDFGGFPITPWRQRDEMVYGYALDDLAGVATVLFALQMLRLNEVDTEAWGIFTRAEEVGFVGTQAICRSNGLPEQMILISVECSSMMSGSQLGSGPIIRVGDKSSVFSPEVTHMLSQVAWEIADKDRKFQYQKTLMTGGTCEASIYQLYGYKAGAICYPLGNYHNMGKRFLSEEFVNSRDLMNGIWLLHDCAVRLPVLMASGEVYGWLKDRFSWNLDEKIDKLLKNPLPSDKITEEEMKDKKSDSNESVPIAYGDAEMDMDEDRFVADRGDEFEEE